MRPRVLILTGMSGAGKTTAATKMLEDDRFERVVTTTTRTPREGEVDGVHYHFVTNPEFDRLKYQCSMLEHADVYDHQYGSTKRAVGEILDRGKTAIMVVDVQGAHAIRKRLPVHVRHFTVFMQSEASTMYRRLEARGENDQSIRRRLVEAEKEVRQGPLFDIVVDTDHVTVEETVATILAALGQDGGREASHEPEGGEG